MSFFGACKKLDHHPTTNLGNIDLQNSNLMKKNLKLTDLRNSNLASSNLSYTNLSYSKLMRSNLSGCNFLYADLTFADLTGANLENCDLRGARLMGCWLRETNLKGAIIDEYTVLPRGLTLKSCYSMGIKFVSSQYKVSTQTKPKEEDEGPYSVAI